jgi:hypothetical protein
MPKHVELKITTFDDDGSVADVKTVTGRGCMISMISEDEEVVEASCQELGKDEERNINDNGNFVMSSVIGLVSGKECNNMLRSIIMNISEHAPMFPLMVLMSMMDELSGSED